MGFIQTVLGRVLAAWIAGLASWLTVKFGISIDPADQAEMVKNLISIAMPVFMTIYAIAHKLLNKKLNPGDAASSTLADSESNEVARLKAAKRFTS